MNSRKGFLSFYFVFGLIFLFEICAATWYILWAKQWCIKYVATVSKDFVMTENIYTYTKLLFYGEDYLINREKSRLRII